MKVNFLFRYNLRFQVFTAGSDALIVILALALASYLRIHIPYGKEAVLETFINPFWLYGVGAAIWVMIGFYSGSYYARPDALPFATLRQVISNHLLASLIFLGTIYLFHRDFSRLQAFYFLSLVMLGLLGHRLLLHSFSPRLAHLIHDQRRILIIGQADQAARLARKLMRWQQVGLHVVETVTIDERAGDLIDPIAPVPEMVKRLAINEVIVATRWYDEASAKLITRLMKDLHHSPVNVRVSPDYADLAYFRVSADDLHGIPLIGLREAVLTPFQRVAKRALDLLLSLTVLTLSLPLIAAIALAIRLDSPGPIIFRQRRIGQHGREFTIYKFRTMFHDAPRGPEDGYVKRADDPRVTRVGRFLRRTSLDELPQFFNVLIGDMSIVGPRPEMVQAAAYYTWGQQRRLEVPQGITGWWQTHGRADRPLRDHIDDDLYYIRHYSFWLDLWIILRTIPSVLSLRGAY